MFLSNWVINKKNVWTKPNIRSNACISMHKPVSTSFSQHWKSATCSLGCRRQCQHIAALRRLGHSSAAACCCRGFSSMPWEVEEMLGRDLLWKHSKCWASMFLPRLSHNCPASSGSPRMRWAGLRHAHQMQMDWPLSAGKTVSDDNTEKRVKCAKDSKVTSRCNCMFWIFKPTASLLCIARSFSFHSGLQILSLSTCLLKAAPIKK